MTLRRCSSEDKWVEGTPAPSLDARLDGDLEELGAFAREFAAAKGLGDDDPPSRRVDVEPQSIEQGLARLVLSIIDLLVRLMEKQALRRIDAGSLTDEQIERMGETFLKLDERLTELKATFGLADEDLTLELGRLRDLLPDDRE